MSGLSASKCSKSRDLIAIAICDSNRESRITSDLKRWGGNWPGPVRVGPPGNGLALRICVHASFLLLLRLVFLFWCALFSAGF